MPPLRRWLTTIRTHRQQLRSRTQLRDVMPPASAPVPTVDTTQPSVLVVEDSPDLAHLLIMHLHTQTERCATAHLDGPVHLVNARAAVRTWLGWQPPRSVGLVVLDYHLADGTSLPALQELRPAHPRPQHPALCDNAVIVGWSTDRWTARAFQAHGADGFMWKGRSTALVEDLLAIVREVRVGATWIERPAN